MNLVIPSIALALGAGTSIVYATAEAGSAATAPCAAAAPAAATVCCTCGKDTCPECCARKVRVLALDKAHAAKLATVDPDRAREFAEQLRAHLGQLHQNGRAGDACALGDCGDLPGLELHLEALGKDLSDLGLELADSFGDGEANAFFGGAGQGGCCEEHGAWNADVQRKIEQALARAKVHAGPQQAAAMAKAKKAMELARERMVEAKGEAEAHRAQAQESARRAREQHAQAFREHASHGAPDEYTRSLERRIEELERRLEERDGHFAPAPPAPPAAPAAPEPPAAPPAPRDPYWFHSKGSDTSFWGADDDASQNAYIVGPDGKGDYAVGFGADDDEDGVKAYRFTTRSGSGDEGVTYSVGGKGVYVLGPDGPDDNGGHGHFHKIVVDGSRGVGKSKGEFRVVVPGAREQVWAWSDDGEGEVHVECREPGDCCDQAPEAEEAEDVFFAPLPAEDHQVQRFDASLGDAPLSFTRTPLRGSLEPRVLSLQPPTAEAPGELADEVREMRDEVRALRELLSSLRARITDETTGQLR